MDERRQAQGLGHLGGSLRGVVAAFVLSCCADLRWCSMHCAHNAEFLSVGDCNLCGAGTLPLTPPSYLLGSRTIAWACVLLLASVVSFNTRSVEYLLGLRSHGSRTLTGHMVGIDRFSVDSCGSHGAFKLARSGQRTKQGQSIETQSHLQALYLIVLNWYRLKLLPLQKWKETESSRQRKAAASL